MTQTKSIWGDRDISKVINSYLQGKGFGLIHDESCCEEPNSKNYIRHSYVGNYHGKKDEVIKKFSEQIEKFLSKNFQGKSLYLPLARFQFDPHAKRNEHALVFIFSTKK